MGDSYAPTPVEPFCCEDAHLACDVDHLLPNDVRATRLKELVVHAFARTRFSE